MRIKHVVPILAKRYLNINTRRRTVFLRGKSGIGKSDVVKQASDFLSEHVSNWMGVIDLRLSQMDPTDVRGIPHVQDGRTQWAPPSFLPSTGAGIIFLDEITSAPPAVQAAAYQLTLTPEDFGIPPEWMVIAAGNTKSDRGVTFNLAGPLQNRMCDIEVVSTLDCFIDHAVTQDIAPEVISFLRDRPDLLHKFEPSNEMKPFPSPRSWFAVSDILSLGMPEADRIEQIKGDVGEEAALVFETHLRVWQSMPRIDDILDGKDVEVPKELNIRYCIAMGLAMRLDEHNIDDAWKFVAQLSGDIQTLIMRLAYKRDRGVSRSPAFSKWAIDNAAAFSEV
jgi:hypothetical protein